MSKLLEHIQVIETNERKALTTPPLKMVNISTEYYDMRVGGYTTVYRVNVKFGAQVAITDEIKNQIAPAWKEVLKAKVYRPLAEEVFGEFRKPLMDADLAIYQGDYSKASTLINAVLESMFKV